ncbi:MAG: hypothetical protein ABH814_00335 [bacterium]
MEKDSPSKIKKTGNTLSAFLALPRNTTFDAQEKGEQIILLMRRHWATNIWWILVTFFFDLPAPFSFPAFI